MPWDQVMHKWKAGTLHSGSGGQVTNRKQAIAIMLHEKRMANKGVKEYRSKKVKKQGIGPSLHVIKRHRTRQK